MRWVAGPTTNFDDELPNLKSPPLYVSASINVRPFATRDWEDKGDTQEACPSLRFPAVHPRRARRPCQGQAGVVLATISRPRFSQYAGCAHSLVSLAPALLTPATGLSVMSIILQLKNYRMPALQRCVVRIMVMYGWVFSVLMPGCRCTL